MAVQIIIEVNTQKGPSITDITDLIQKKVKDLSGEIPGIIHIFLTGTTASLVLNENEPGLISDVKKLFEELCPEKKWEHDSSWGEGNAHSHLRNILTGPSLTIPFDGKQLQLGTWQRIILVEWDTRPRTRKIIITIIS